MELCGGQAGTASISSSGVSAPITPNTTSNNQAVDTTTATTETSTTISTGASAPIKPTGAESTNSDTSSGVTVAVPPVIPLATDAVGNTVAAAGNAAASASTAIKETAANAANTVAHAANSLSAASTAPTASANMAAPYRVSVGAFGNPANAKKRVAAFKAKGFPAFGAKQGALNLVLVGPYETEAEAIRVANEIKSSGLEPGATVIKFNPNASISHPSNSSNRQTSTVTKPAATTTTTTANATTARATGTAPTTSAAGSYLQVGAYNNSESAQPLRRQLSELGFETYELQDGNLIKILVGPYDATNLAIAQSVLKTNGFDSFVR